MFRSMFTLFIVFLSWSRWWRNFVSFVFWIVNFEMKSSWSWGVVIMKLRVGEDMYAFCVNSLHFVYFFIHSFISVLFYHEVFKYNVVLLHHAMLTNTLLEEANLGFSHEHCHTAIKLFCVCVCVMHVVLWFKKQLNAVSIKISKWRLQVSAWGHTQAKQNVQAQKRAARTQVYLHWLGLGACLYWMALTSLQNGSRRTPSQSGSQNTP